MGCMSSSDKSDQLASGSAAIADKSADFGLKKWVKATTELNYEIAKNTIIFVHGLTGKREGTWTNESKVLWPQDWLPKYFTSCDIWGYGYKTAFTNATTFSTDFDDISQSLAVAIQSNDIEGNIIFVVHSLGGIIVKKMMLYAKVQNGAMRSIFTNTKGIIFISTPHEGSNRVVIGQLLAGIGLHKNVKDLAPSKHLEELNRVFAESVNDRTVFIFSFYENKTERMIFSCLFSPHPYHPGDCHQTIGGFGQL